VLLVIYTVVTPAVPFAFSSQVLDPVDLVTGYREFNLRMCAFNVDSPVLALIFIYKALIIAGGGIMAFFIRQVDRRFSATTALGWAFFNMVLTVVIAFGFEYETYAALESSLFIPIFCGLWIVFFTLGALTLDSNVLMACRGFSKPLRRMLKPNSKDSKDPQPKVSTNGDAQESNSGPKMSHSSTIFIVNREMFPTKYDDFEGDVLEQIVTELKFQLAAVRRAMVSSPGSAASTTVEMTDLDRRRNSTQVDSAHRFSSKPKFGLAPPSANSRESSSGDSSPRNVTGSLPEPPSKTSESSSNIIVPEPLCSREMSHSLIVVVEPASSPEIVVSTVE